MTTSILNRLHSKKLVCFDLDGTLIDSVGVWNQVDAALILQLSGHQIDLNLIQQDRDQQLSFFKNHADPYLEYCDFLKEKYHFVLEKNQVKEQRYAISHHFLDHVICLKPEADLFLHYLHQHHIQTALTTTTSLSNIQRYQKNNQNIYSKLNFSKDFSLILTRDKVKKIKPDPEIYLNALSYFQLQPKDCLIIEDSLIGVQAAHAAGIDVIAIYDQYSDHEWSDIQNLATENYHSYAEMLDIIQTNTDK
ncbi:HAD family hydrolase [Acinetobacter equi]|uniref:Haloacid dehalogenase n=1 Tax=Acinetobacter equi TaxID=1324350 RepID=A0A0N9VZM4_9GAMM|nr:HAD family phosphatase [Acinetobacter equi]ALH94730.1 haloacid dehalogenase [Acinetobacter equi]